LLIARLTAAALAALSAAAAANTIEIRGRVTNRFTEEKYRTAQIVVTDRLGVELGRATADRRGRYELKISGPRYIILKALMEGYPAALYQIDTEEIKESTTDREENRVFGDLRIPTYHQDVTFVERSATPGLEELLDRENPAAVKAYQAARKQRDSGEAKKAIGAFEKLVRQYPDFYLGHIDLGMLLAAQQENDRALEVFSQASKLRPDHPWAYVGLGLALNNKQEYRAATQHLEKAVQLQPNSVNALFHLGVASFKLGAHERAAWSLEQVIALDPKFSPLAYKTLASIYAARQDPQRAARALESYLEHFPNAADAEKVRQILARLRP
jgi:Flp pilus assembly protein TadD